jgi:hypothetical protein
MSGVGGMLDHLARDKTTFRGRIPTLILQFPGTVRSNFTTGVLMLSDLILMELREVDLCPMSMPKTLD